MFGFLGLNGAGKSTTLKVLGCVLLPTSGKVVIDGFDVATEPHEIRKRIGFLPDTPPVYEEMTVGGYLEFVARLRGVPHEKVADHVRDAEVKTAITNMHQMPIFSLSHGYRQRVGAGAGAGAQAEAAHSRRADLRARPGADRRDARR